MGDRVTLPCRVENKVGTLQWTKDDFGLGTHRNLSGYDRYVMVGSDEEGKHLLINHVNYINRLSLLDIGLVQKSFGLVYNDMQTNLNFILTQYKV